MKRLLALVLAGALGFWSCSKPVPSSPVVEEAARAYRSLRLMTPIPVQVNARLATLCVGPTQAMIDGAKKRYGPHFMASVRIYMSGSAAKAFGNRNPNYPVGAVVVKEKELGVGGMIKRPPGYDPGHGDWEYFYFEDISRIEHGKIASCVGCHAGAQDRDYVFGEWAKER